jgi:hypothetical protein
VRVGIGTRRWWSLLLVAAAAAAVVGLGCGGPDGGARNRPDLAATVVREERVAPRLLDLTIRSPALGTDAKARQ